MKGKWLNLFSVALCFGLGLTLSHAVRGESATPTAKAAAEITAADPGKAADKANAPAATKKTTVDPAKAADKATVPTAAKKSPATEAQKVTPKAVGPSQTLQNNIAELKATLNRHKKTGTAVNPESRNAEVRKKVRLLLDYNHLGRLALGRHWKTTPAAKRNEFLSLFRSLVEKSYIAKLDSLVADYDMNWLGEKVTGNKATVDSSVVREEADVEIEYKMQRTKNSWVVYNIVFDDLDLAQNYQTQFNKIIVDKGFDQLLAKMRSKLGQGQFKKN